MSFFSIFNLLNKKNYISHEEYIERLKECHKCKYRVKTNLGFMSFNNCALCGCFNLEKAKLKESKGGLCPDTPERWKRLNN